MGMTSYCFIAAQFLRDPLKSGVQVTPAFLRSTKPSKRESGLVAAAPSTSVQAGPNSSGGVYGPPRPYSPDTAAHRGRITGDFMTEKNNSSLLQHRKTQQAAESMTGQRPVSFLPFGLWPQSGSGLPPELRPAYSRTRCLPHMRVGKNSFPGHAGNGVTGALRTAGNTLGLSRALFIPWKIPKTGRIRPKPLSGAGTPPPRKWDTQQLTGGHVGGLSLPQEVGHPLAFRCQLQLRQLAVIVLVNCLSDSSEGKQQISIALFLLSW